MSITGIILAGGLARRMGGIDKGLVQFAGKPMVAHVIDRLKPQVNDILINANREIAQYAALGFQVISDEIEGFAGPLAGLHKGMSVASQPFVLTVPCDSPFLPTDLAERLMADLLANAADVTVAKIGTQAQPVFCLCKTSLKNHLESFLQSGGRKIDTWYGTLNVIEVAFDDKPEAFANINTIEELQSLEDRPL
ncbi:MAG: molybdenum cofactor guanylyltransferase MobA [Methylophilaceae bacterium]|nr:molybdenum cofactor guanylyltransferase MobA [Methylophilaceae bacterium]